MDAEESKYARIEYERRFLVSPHSDWRSVVESYSKTFEDKYLHQARLRLRILTDSDTGRHIIKLTKKFESSSPYYQTINRILLSPGEYELLDSLEGDRLKKVRHYHICRGRAFSVDVFEGELVGLVLCEIEAEGIEELMSIEPPSFVIHEVTDDIFFTGGNLCRITNGELLHKLAAGRTK
jgi:CYTH domain-containing protein